MRPLRTTLLVAAALTWLAPAPAFADDSSPDTSAKKPDKKGDKAAEKEEEEEKAKVTNKIPTLADKIPPVSGAFFVEGGRHELSPEIDFSINDPFFQKYMFGLKYAYHISSQWSVGARFVYGVATPASSVNVCGATGCGSPTLNQLAQTPGDISIIVGADVAWAPLYGKMSLMAEKVIHFDTFVVAGADGIQYHNPAASPAGTAVFTGGGHVGVGEHFILNSWFGIRLDLRDYIYPGQRDVNGVAQSGVENQLMLELGASFFFPLHPQAD